MATHPDRSSGHLVCTAGRDAVLRLAIVTLLFLPALATDAFAQPSRVEADSIRRRIQNIEPRSGPVGTVVTVSSGLMPAITPIRIGFGSSSGFEDLEALLTSPRGEFSTKVTVPAWATRDRGHRFIVFDIYFRPIALSDPFHVTDAQGRLSREGRITSEGTECTAMRDAHGDLYTLTGTDVATLRPEDRVIVEGTLADASVCAQGTTIRVTSIRRRTPSSRTRSDSIETFI